MIVRLGNCVIGYSVIGYSVIGHSVIGQLCDGVTVWLGVSAQLGNYVIGHCACVIG